MTTNQSFQRLFKSARNDNGYKLDDLILEITEQIVTQMEADDISKSELAASIGASAPYITKVLKGETNFTAESLVKIADALKCDVQVKLVPRTNIEGWVGVFGKAVEPKRELQVWVQEARVLHNRINSFECPSFFRFSA